MGGANSKQGRREKHFFFKEVMRKKDYGKHTVVVCNPILNKEEYREWEDRYKKTHGMNKDALLIPENYEYKKLDKSVGACNCCGAEGETEMTYEDTAFSLHQEISNRRSKNTPYSQEELTFFLYTMLQGVKEFQLADLRFGDIRTKNILVTKSNELKMVNVCSFPDERTSVDKVLDRFDNTTVFFFAPEEIEFIKNFSKALDVPNPKTEGWAVGLCILEAATLKDSEDIYEMPGRKIKENVLNQRLNAVRSSFITLHHYLNCLLQMNPAQRMAASEVWAILRPYSEQITELNSFKRNPQVENESLRKFLSGGSGRR